MENSGFYDAGLLRQIATNLFYGWGYNFYRVENQLRADDQLVRTKAASLLGTIRRADGSRQVTYAGRPLYFYVGDTKAGQVRCQNVFEYGGLWLVVRGSGLPVK